MDEWKYEITIGHDLYKDLTDCIQIVGLSKEEIDSLIEMLLPRGFQILMRLKDPFGE